ncbi:MAG TPA: glycogen synthase GlgA [Candidatus Bathyarchaeia archaeon]|nr:glycogen synthase GlgA [Candidatus Bathyarchaeia archaeon]
MVNDNRPCPTAFSRPGLPWYPMKPLKILYVCVELSPHATMGGLGDVANALPRVLQAQGHDVRFALPCYKSLPAHMIGDPYGMVVADLGAKTAYGALRISTIPGTQIPLYLIEHDGYFGRKQLYGDGVHEYEDNAERFCFFSLAVLHGVALTGWRPDVVHCNDWHTAAMPAFIKTRLAHTLAWRAMPTLFTIHNLAYQGRYKARYLPFTGLSPTLFTPDCLEFYGDLNLMKAGIAFASRVNTVSPTYAKEIQTPQFGQGLDGFLRTRTKSLSGILNGVDYDAWHPAKDNFIPANYGHDDLSGKKTCKKYLQKMLGLPVKDVPLIGMVTRLYWQKGVDLLIQALPKLLNMDLQLIILGTGNPYFEQPLKEAAALHANRLKAILQFDIRLAHLFEAGSDFFLMPSHFEPCGLSQLYSLAYGAVPIVRRTGGLADSVSHISKANLRNASATGIVFKEATAVSLVDAVRHALRLYASPETLRGVQLAGMESDFSWYNAADAYTHLYRQAMARP